MRWTMMAQPTPIPVSFEGDRRLAIRRRRTKRKEGSGIGLGRPELSLLVLEDLLRSWRKLREQVSVALQFIVYSNRFSTRTGGPFFSLRALIFCSFMRIWSSCLKSPEYDGFLDWGRRSKGVYLFRNSEKLTLLIKRTEPAYWVS